MGKGAWVKNGFLCERGEGQGQNGWDSKKHSKNITILTLNNLSNLCRYHEIMRIPFSSHGWTLFCLPMDVHMMFFLLLMVVHMLFFFPWFNEYDVFSGAWDGWTLCLLNLLALLDRFD